MKRSTAAALIPLDCEVGLWENTFNPAPLVLIGSRDVEGRDNFAPKHMAMALGHGAYFGFVCTPRHSTYRNIEAQREFTVTFPRPSQVVLASLAAGPRDADDVKPAIGYLPTFAAREIGAAFLDDGYLFLECRLDRLVEGFGDDCLVAGRVVAAYAHRQALRASDGDDQQLVLEAPVLTYLHPGRWATITESFSFPYPRGFER